MLADGRVASEGSSIFHDTAAPLPGSTSSQKGFRRGIRRFTSSLHNGLTYGESAALFASSSLSGRYHLSIVEDEFVVFHFHHRLVSYLHIVLGLVGPWLSFGLFWMKGDKPAAALYAWINTATAIVWLLCGLVMLLLRYVQRGASPSSAPAAHEFPDAVELGHKNLAIIGKHDLFCADDPVRCSLRRNAAAHEVVLLVMMVNLGVFIASLHYTKPQCNGITIASYDYCVHIIFLHSFAVLAVPLCVGLAPMRAHMFALSLAFLCAINIVVFFLPGAPQFDSEVFVLDVAMMVMECVASTMYRYTKDVKSRREFEAYVWRCEETLTTQAVRRETERVLASRVPLAIVQSGELQHHTGNGNDRLCLWRDDAVLGCVRLDRWAAWASLRSPSDCVWMLQQVFHTLDSIRQQFGADRLARYHVYGDIYLVRDECSVTDAHQQRQDPTSVTFIAAQRVLVYLVVAVASVHKVVEQNRSTNSAYQDSKYLTPHDVAERRTDAQDMLNVSGAADCGECGVLLSATPRPALRLVGPAVDPTIAMCSNSSRRCHVTLTNTLLKLLPARLVESLQAQQIVSFPMAAVSEYFEGSDADITFVELLDIMLTPSSQSGPHDPPTTSSTDVAENPLLTTSRESRESAGKRKRKKVVTTPAVMSISVAQHCQSYSMDITDPWHCPNDALGSLESNNPSTLPLVRYFGSPALSHSRTDAANPGDSTTPVSLVDHHHHGSLALAHRFPFLFVSFEVDAVERAYHNFILCREESAMDTNVFTGSALLYSTAFVLVCLVEGLYNLHPLQPLFWFVCLTCTACCMVATPFATDALCQSSTRHLRVVVTLNSLFFLYSGLLTVGVFLAPPGNLLYSNRMPWLFLFYGASAKRPQWFSVPAMFAQELAVSLAFLFAVTLEFNGPTSFQRAATQYCIGLVSATCLSIRLLWDRHLRAQFVSEQELRLTQERLEKDYVKLGEALESLAPVGAAADLARNLRKKGVTYEEIMLSEPSAARPQNPERSTHFTTSVAEVPYALIDCGTHYYPPDISARDSIAESMRALAHVKQLVLSSLQHACPSRVEVLSWFGDTVVLCTPRAAPSEALPHEDHDEERCFSVAVAALLCMEAIRFENTQRQSTTPRARTRCVMSTGLMIGAVLGGAGCMPFEYHGPSIAQASSVVRQLPWGLCGATWKLVWHLEAYQDHRSFQRQKETTATAIEKITLSLKPSSSNSAQEEDPGSRIAASHGEHHASSSASRNTTRTPSSAQQQKDLVEVRCSSDAITCRVKSLYPIVLHQTTLHLISTTSTQFYQTV